MTERDFDAILEILKLGKWNLFYYFLIFVTFGLMIPCVMYSGTYVTPAVNHTCVISSDFDVDETDQCTYKLFSNTSNEEEVKCTEWIFHEEENTRTMTADFKLVCENAYLRPTYQTMYMTGNFVGAPISGFLSDKYGRKTMLIITASVGTVIVFISTFLTNFSSILLIRFIAGAMFHPVIQIGYILCMEICEPKHRTVVGILLSLPWAIGTIWWGVLGYFIRDWQWLQIASIVPGMIFLVLMWFLDESPRWLIVKGHHDRALKVIKRAARWNNATLPPDEELLNNMLEIQKFSITAIEATTKRRSIRSTGYRERVKNVFKEIFVLFRTPELRRRTLLMYIVFVVAATVFYGLTLNAVNFQLDPYLYMMVTGLVEAPASIVIIPIVAKFGRIPSTVVSYFICGGTIMALTFIPSGDKWLIITLAMIGKFCIASAYIIIYLMTSEVFPTEVRVQGLGTSCFISSIGSAVAPYITDFIGPLFPRVPSIVFGTLSILAGVTAIFMPETLNKPLPETIVQLETETKQMKLKKRYNSENEGGSVRFDALNE